MADLARIGIVNMSVEWWTAGASYTRMLVQSLAAAVAKEKIELLSAGKSYIARIPPTEIKVARGRGFSTTSDFSRIAEMDAVIVHSHESVTLDFSCVAHIVNTGLSKVVGLHHRVRVAGGHLLLQNLRPLIREVFVAAMLDGFLTLSP